jgi:hypothetical protein
MDLGKVYMQSAEYYYRKYYGGPGPLVLKALISLNLYLEKRLERPAEYEPIFSGDDPAFLIEWQPVRDAAKYLIEVSYSLNFVDRAGCCIKETSFTLPTSVLARLPHRKGFLRILPIYPDGSTGKVIRVVQLAD